MSEKNNSIQLVQSPIIKHSLENVGANVTERIKSLNIENQVATEDTISTLKEMRASLNKEAKEFETQRKGIKDAVLSPYNEFESTYKSQIIDKYKEADELLKVKINEFEMKIKQEKKENLISYFKELVELEQIDWLSFDRLKIDVTLSTSEKKYKEQILAFVQKVVDDLDLIKTETHSAEMLVEFKSSLNSSQAIQIVRKRKEDERIESERLKYEITKKRSDQIRSLTFVYHDLTRTFNWIHDESILISLSDIENLSDDEWRIRLVGLEAKAKKEESTPILQAPTVEQPKEKPVQESKEAIQEEIFEAKFTVKGTYLELKALGEFLKSNNYNYQNIK